jgi:hypothetical protein
VLLSSHDRLRGGRPVPQRAVRFHRVAVFPPTLDRRFGFPQRVEELPVEKFVAQLAVEALAVPVLPRAPRLDKQRLHAHFAQPPAHRLGRELGGVVRADVRRHAPRHEEPRQPFEHIVTPLTPGHIDRQALPRELVNHRQHPELPPVVRPVLYKVVRPYVISYCSISQPNVFAS